MENYTESIKISNYLLFTKTRCNVKDNYYKNAVSPKDKDSKNITTVKRKNNETP